ncbi:UNVERIFIED_CONTAM: hypothetical protein Sradi_3804200 [Sesamum radiatum]|uniref:DUF4283 domain-containing protein n=1 Tax=Sesamum radiatum TaxID=300843 RepID=A0AAW2Q0F7_SESRA
MASMVPPNPTSATELRPLDPPDQRRSFLAAPTADREGEPLSLCAAKKIFTPKDDYYGRPCTYRGGRAINFSMTETEILSVHLKFALISKFSHGYLSMQVIRTYFAKLGLRGAYSIGVINVKHIIIKFSNEDDFSRVWLKQIMFLNGFPMRIFKWMPDFNPRIESPITPVWIWLSELPVHLFHKKALFGIASLIGTPLKLDEDTTDGLRPSVAWICVEIDLTKPRPEVIWLGTEGKYISQPVQYERCPKYCLQCKHLGHGIEECREGKQDLLKTREVEKVPVTEDLRTILNRKREKKVEKDGVGGSNPIMEDEASNMQTTQVPNDVTDSEGNDRSASIPGLETIAENEENNSTDNTVRGTRDVAQKSEHVNLIHTICFFNSESNEADEGGSIGQDVEREYETSDWNPQETSTLQNQPLDDEDLEDAKRKGRHKHALSLSRPEKIVTGSIARAQSSASLEI